MGVRVYRFSRVNVMAGYCLITSGATLVNYDFIFQGMQAEFRSIDNLLDGKPGIEFVNWDVALT